MMAAGFYNSIGLAGSPVNTLSRRAPKPAADTMAVLSSCCTAKGFDVAELWLVAVAVDSSFTVFISRPVDETSCWTDFFHIIHWGGVFDNSKGQLIVVKSWCLWL